MKGKQTLAHQIQTVEVRMMAQKLILVATHSAQMTTRLNPQFKTETETVSQTRWKIKTEMDVLMKVKRTPTKPTQMGMPYPMVWRSTGLNPLNEDSDADGIKDGVRYESKMDRWMSMKQTRAEVDSDGDGISDGIEDLNRDGRRQTNELDPIRADTDGDGIPDGIEDQNRDGQVGPNEASST